MNQANIPNGLAVGSVAETIGRFLHKGSQVHVEGKIRTSSYEKDGQKRYSTEVVLDPNGLIMLGSRQNSNNDGNFNSVNRQPYGQNGQNEVYGALPIIIVVITTAINITSLTTTIALIVTITVILRIIVKIAMVETISIAQISTATIKPQAIALLTKLQALAHIIRALAMRWVIKLQILCQYIPDSFAEKSAPQAESSTLDTPKEQTLPKEPQMVQTTEDDLPF